MIFRRPGIDNNLAGFRLDHRVGGSLPDPTCSNAQFRAAIEQRNARTGALVSEVPFVVAGETVEDKFFEGDELFARMVAGSIRECGVLWRCGWDTHITHACPPVEPFPMSE